MRAKAPRHRLHRLESRARHLRVPQRSLKVPAHSGPTNWRAGEGGAGLQEPGGPGRPMGHRLPRSRGPQTLGDGSASRQTDRASSPGVGNDLPRTELGRRPKTPLRSLLGRHRHLGTAQGGGIAFLASGPETRPCPRAERAVGRARKCGRGHLFRFTVRMTSKVAVMVVFASCGGSIASNPGNADGGGDGGVNVASDGGVRPNTRRRVRPVRSGGAGRPLDAARESDRG